MCSIVKKNLNLCKIGRIILLYVEHKINGYDYLDSQLTDFVEKRITMAYYEV